MIEKRETSFDVNTDNERSLCFMIGRNEYTVSPVAWP